MPFVIPYPDIDPALVTIELFGLSLPIRWYALAYLGGMLAGLVLVRRMLARPALWPDDTPPMTKEQAEALLTWMVIGVILGGRLGYVLFYQPGFFLDNPASVFQVWQGGMSFHGGLIGVVLGILGFSWREGAPKFQVGDAVSTIAPVGLLFGRLANFINGELWGRPTDVPWAMVFPGAGDAPRHPSQLYEAALEGLALFVLLWTLATWRGWLKRPGAITGVLFIGYGAARALIELYREPDAQFVTGANPAGHVIRFTAEHGLTIGQTLSLPMIAVGLGFLAYSRRSARAA